MNISSMNATSLSTLFSGLNSTSSSSYSSSSNYGINLGQLASIQNGSYYTALKAYYAQEESETTSSDNSDSVSSLSRMQTSASEVNDSVATLMKNGDSSVFAKKTTTGEDGTTTTSYDVDKIYKAVSTFVDSYNSLIENTVSTNSTQISTQASSLINMTATNASLLSQIGISVDSSDYTLSIDEETFKSADMTTVKSLLHDTGSYGYQVSVKASMISNYAQNLITQKSNYGSSGSYSYYSVSGSSFNTTT